MRVTDRRLFLFEQCQIAIVDDDRSFRDSMRRLLKSLDYAVVVFPSAADFLASPKLTDTACLVADVHMPAMTGIELYRHLIETGIRSQRFSSPRIRMMAFRSAC